MRRFRALARSAAIETLAEPLSCVLFLVALLTVPLLPVFHCHQFGEPGRLPRECGFSALLVFGIVFATSSAVRIIGGEVQSGTAAAALARDVPRPLFFCAKIAGVFSAFAIFAVAVTASTLLAVATAEIGEARAAVFGGSHVWMPGLAAAVGLTLVAFAAAAASNRFLGTRFCVGACLALSAAQLVALAATIPMAPVRPALALVPALGLLAVGCCVFIAMAGALAVRLPPAAVTACLSLAVLSSFVWPATFVLPDIQRFWLVDSFAGGGAPSAPMLFVGIAAGLLLVAFWLVAGSVLLERRDIP